MSVIVKFLKNSDEMIKIRTVTEEQYDTIDAFTEAVVTGKVDNIEVNYPDDRWNKALFTALNPTLNYRIKSSKPEPKVDKKTVDDEVVAEMFIEIKRIHQEINAHQKDLEFIFKQLQKIVEILPSAHL